MFQLDIFWLRPHDHDIYRLMAWGALKIWPMPGKVAMVAPREFLQRSMDVKSIFWSMFPRKSYRDLWVFTGFDDSLFILNHPILAFQAATPVVPQASWLQKGKTSWIFMDLACVTKSISNLKKMRKKHLEPPFFSEDLGDLFVHHPTDPPWRHRQPIRPARPGGGTRRLDDFGMFNFWETTEFVWKMRVCFGWLFVCFVFIVFQPSHLRR